MAAVASDTRVDPLPVVCLALESLVFPVVGRDPLSVPRAPRLTQAQVGPVVVDLVVPRVQGPPSPGALAQRRPRCPWSQMTPPPRPLLQALAGSPYPHPLSGCQ